MSVEEAKKQSEAIRAVGKRIRKSPASARRFLMKYKILTPQGELAKRFRE